MAKSVQDAAGRAFRETGALASKIFQTVEAIDSGVQGAAAQEAEAAHTNKTEALAYEQAQHENNAKLIGLEYSQGKQGEVVSERQAAYDKMVHGGRGNTREKRAEALNDLQAAQAAFNMLEEKKQAALAKKARYQLEIDKRTGGNK